MVRTRFGAMFLVIDAHGRHWDGFAWAAQGKEFFSVASATRSLHESGEDLDEVLFVPSQKAKYDTANAVISYRSFATL